MIQTSREKREQLLFLAVMVVLGVVAIVGGLAYGLELEERVGPGLMPFAAGILMLVTVGVQLVRRLRIPVEEAATPESEGAPDAGRSAGRPNPRLVAAIFGSIVLAVAATYLIGMLLAVSLLVGALFLLNDRHKILSALIAAVAAGIFGWLVFETLLEVPLPTGLLGLI